jgi:hypothetical protein
LASVLPNGKQTGVSPSFGVDEIGRDQFLPLIQCEKYHFRNHCMSDDVKSQSKHDLCPASCMITVHNIRCGIAAVIGGWNTCFTALCAAQRYASFTWTGFAPRRALGIFDLRAL